MEWISVFARNLDRGGLLRRVSRSRGRKGKMRRKWEGGRVWVSRREIMFGCPLTERSIRASRFGSWGGWLCEGVVSLMARVCGFVVLLVRRVLYIVEKRPVV